MTFAIGATYSVNSNVPITEPCGTPYWQPMLDDCVWPTRTDWKRHTRYELTQLSADRIIRKYIGDVEVVWWCPKHRRQKTSRRRQSTAPASRLPLCSCRTNCLSAPTMSLHGCGQTGYNS